MSDEGKPPRLWQVPAKEKFVEKFLLDWGVKAFNAALGLLVGGVALVWLYLPQLAPHVTRAAPYAVPVVTCLLGAQVGFWLGRRRRKEPAFLASPSRPSTPVPVSAEPFADEPGAISCVIGPVDLALAFRPEAPAATEMLVPLQITNPNSEELLVVGAPEVEWDCPHEVVKQVGPVSIRLAGNDVPMPLSLGPGRSYLHDFTICLPVRSGVGEPRRFAISLAMTHRIRGRVILHVQNLSRKPLGRVAVHYEVDLFRLQKQAFEQWRVDERTELLTIAAAAVPRNSNIGQFLRRWASDE